MRERSTSLFKGYCVRLAVRAAVFAWGVALLAADPQALNPLTRFGPAAGLSYPNVLFVLIVLDILTKFRPNAKIAMGSLKQYRGQFRPSELLGADPDRLLAHLREAHRQGAAAVAETVDGLKETARSIRQEAASLRLVAGEEGAVDARRALRDDIRRRRLREIVPVIVFWVLLNAAVAGLLHGLGWLNPSTATLWCAFYFLFDMVCVVAWCPLQLMLMRNRCCTTCQIFNWDAVMTVTPLVFVGGWFSWVLGALSAVVLLRWEAAFMRHPERFDERTNEALRCVNCHDKLCRVRGPLRAEGR